MTFQTLEQHKNAVLHHKFIVRFRLDLIITSLFMVQAQEKKYTSPLKYIVWNEILFLGPQACSRLTEFFVQVLCPTTYYYSNTTLQS